MPEKGKDSIYQKQKAVRPKIDDVIGDLLDGEKLKHASEFIAYLRENKMNPQWGSANSWKVSYKNYGICYIRAGGGLHASHNLETGSWHICFSGGFNKDYEGFILNENLREIAWDNVKYCLNCSVCKPGDHVTVLGKEFDKVCRHSHIVMRNPNAAALECAKKLLGCKINAISCNNPVL